MNFGQRTHRCTAFALGLLTALSAVCQPEPSMTSTVSIPQFTPDTVAAFADEFFTQDLDQYPIPGAAFVVVHNDAILFSKGYGLADRATDTPVEPAATVFRAGSVSKCFTAAAVVLLADRGAVDLDAPIDEYITSVSVPQPFGPIPVRNLITHSAGFDDTIIDMHERDQSEWLPLADYLRVEMPPPAMPPDKFISYSSWDFALAGLLIEDVTGMPYAQFIDEHIFTPLAMDDSSFELPDPPADLMSRLASGYNYVNGAYKQYPFDYIKASPGIAMLTTAEDMGHFLIAQLNGGVYNATQAMPAPVVDHMQATQFTNHPILRGFTYGFAEWKENGLDALFHDGNAIGHMSRIFLLPEQDVAFFVAYNTVPFGPGGVPSEAGRLNRRLTTAFLDRFFPEEDTTPTPPEPMEAGTQNLERFVGHYRQTNYSRHTFQKIVSLLEQVPVTANADGTLTIGSSKYFQIEPNLFQYHEGIESYVPFREDTDGHITHLHFGTGTYEKVPAIESAPVQMAIFTCFLLLFFAAILSFLLRLMGRLRKKPWPFTWPEAATWLAAIVNILFFIGLARLMLTTDTMELFAGVPPALKLVLSLPIVSAVLTLAACIGLIIRWRQKDAGVAWRLWHTIVVVGLVLFLPLLRYWNLIGY